MQVAFILCSTAEKCGQWAPELPLCSSLGGLSFRWLKYTRTVTVVMP